MSRVSFYSFALIYAGCGPVIENTLRSAGYPNDYPNYNTDCISSVPIPQGMVINITINELYLEDNRYCEYVLIFYVLLSCECRERSSDLPYFLNRMENLNVRKSLSNKNENF